GDTIQPGDLLYTVESDKATQEVESLDAGILRIDPAGPQSGDMVTVGTLLAYIAQPDEAVTFAQPDRSAGIPLAAAPSAPSSSAPTPSPVAAAETDATTAPAISPRARRVATELGVAWQTLTGSGRTGRIVERDVRAAALAQQAEAVPAIRATPVAARMAQDAGIDLARLAAEAPGQRIGRAEVEAAIAAQQQASAPPQPLPPTVAAQRLPITRVRHLIAQRMSESTQTTASVTLTTEADATELVALRNQLKATFAPRHEPVPTYNDLLLKLTATALTEHPLLRAVWGEGEITIAPGIHIGLAVDMDEGLLVPVVRDVQTQSLRQLAATTQALIDQAKTHKLSPDALQGGNFTITNLGMYNIDAFTPIINLPQCAILGVGRIVEKPAVYQGQVVPRHMVALSLTFDHRVVDGAPAARFLDTVRGYVETPLLWLVG
ncbi:MAG: 2-oxo acid dehydrogenase subunit E2, partial [Caldilineaceae bacterium]|nr:2-oxo acid dehydrogenase subunit E2 [Caldilineaceae bacterium]